jgi:hypothetical protein
MVTDDSNMTTISGDGNENYDVINTDDSNVTNIAGEGDGGTSGNRNFCGETYMDASTNCSREKHCPVSWIQARSQFSTLFSFYE